MRVHVIRGHGRQMVGLWRVTHINIDREESKGAKGGRHSPDRRKTNKQTNEPRISA